MGPGATRAALGGGSPSLQATLCSRAVVMVTLSHMKQTEQTRNKLHHTRKNSARIRTLERFQTESQNLTGIELDV